MPNVRSAVLEQLIERERRPEADGDEHPSARRGERPAASARSAATSVNDDDTSTAVASSARSDVEVDTLWRPRIVGAAEHVVRREERREQHHVGGEEHDHPEPGHRAGHQLVRRVRGSPPSTTESAVAPARSTLPRSASGPDRAPVGRQGDLSSRRRAVESSASASRIDRRRSDVIEARSTSPCKGWASRTDSGARRGDDDQPVAVEILEDCETNLGFESRQAERPTQRESFERGAAGRIETGDAALDQFAQPLRRAQLAAEGPNVVVLHEGVVRGVEHQLTQRQYVAALARHSAAAASWVTPLERDVQQRIDVDLVEFAEVDARLPVRRATIA